MIVVKLQGGLGNQMFQYAIGRQVATNLNTKLILDTSSYRNDSLRQLQLTNFKIDANTTENKIIKNLYSLISKFKSFKVFREKETFIYDESYLNIEPYTILEGYWQNYNYFASIKNLLKNDLTLRNIDQKILDYSKKISMTNNPVCLHVRRGDMVTNKEANKVHGAMDLNYYLESIKLAQGKLRDPFFYIFSDDIGWAKENIKDINANFIDFTNTTEPHKDFFLMRSCKHFIIPNSTLSWWAAWLESSDNSIVIAPEKWLSIRKLDLYSNLIPTSWTLI